MVPRYPCYSYPLLCSCLILIIQVLALAAHAQSPVNNPVKKTIKKDTLSIIKDTSIARSKQFVQKQKENVLTNLRSIKPDSIPAWKKDSLKAKLSLTGKNALNKLKQSAKGTITVDLNNPFKKLFITRPAFRINGGVIAYTANYRSLIDTPYAEKDILQHNVTGRWDVTLGGIFPVQVNYWLRQSNSSFFKNIYDVQLSFNGREFQNKIRTSMRERLLALAPSIKDSLLEKAYGLKQAELSSLENTLKTTFNPQKQIEANETLKVPKITWKADQPDSVNLRREDSLKQAAALFLQKYADTKMRYDSLHTQVDSLKDKYQQNLNKVKQFQQMINGNWNELNSARSWKNKLEEYGMENVHIPAKYRWLMGVRNFSIGRSPVNHSELTAKNVSVNGINFEYNSWYYLALTAGTVNYRYRDFAIRNAGKKQYLAMVRAGIGRLEKDYFILSAFRGQKQLVASSTVPITGFGAESRWAINRTTYLTAEVAKSITPDYRNNPPEGNSKFSLSDKNNQAVAFKLSSDLPATKSRVEAFYKKAGANYQSFSSYTTNAAMESWYVKADQNLFKRKLRIAASLRKNEYSNPFLVQDYKSNTVFKSLTATLRVRKWPVVSVGYQPLSQYTKVDEQVIENRFQTFNATLFHVYPVHQLKMATTIMFNKFYNNQTDTGFLYYNATNSYFTQTFYFNSFTANAGISYTKNSNYTLQVMDGGVQPNIPKFGTVGIGIKINNLNNTLIKAGGYVSANIRVFKQDMLFISYEHGYLPGNKHGLVRNEMGTIQFVKTFNFK